MVTSGGWVGLVHWGVGWAWSFIDGLTRIDAGPHGDAVV